MDSSIEMHGNYARNKAWAVSSSDNPVRANGGKPIALRLVPRLTAHTSSHGTCR